MNNLLKNVPDTLPEELFETLTQTDSVHIQRIVSKGQTTPEGEWYDQDKNELVVVLKGAAILKFEDGGEVNMNPGDWQQIPAHKKHRVSWTDPSTETIWLAIHYL